MYHRLTINLKGKARKATLEKRPHLVVPATILKEGVWEGSEGPLYYPDRELSKYASAWNNKPILVYHPEADGRAISGCDPSILNTRSVGRVLNTKHGDATRTECWFDEELVRSVDARVLKAIQNGQAMEVSTGLDLDADGVEGEFNGVKYKATALNYRPDHLAILPDQIGAFPVKDGGGLFAVNAARQPERNQEILKRTADACLKTSGLTIVENELSFGQIGCQLSDLLSAKFGKPGRYWSGYICDIYPDYVVFRDGYDGSGDLPSYYVISYATDGDAVTLDGDAAAVEKTTQYVTTDGTVYAANEAGVISKQGPKGDDEMADKKTTFDKKAHVTHLIANGYAESDREFLEGLPDEALARVKATPAVTNADTGKEKPVEKTVVKETTAEAPKVPTLEDLVANSADPMNRQIFQDMKASYVREKEQLIGVIVANTRNKMPKEYLEKKDLNELRYLAALAGDGQANVQNVGEGGLPPFQQAPNYYGAQGGPPVVNVAADEALKLPDYSDIFKPVTASRN